MNWKEIRNIIPNSKKGKYKNFLEKEKEEQRQDKYLAEYEAGYKEDRDKQAREWGEFAAWDVFSRILTLDDIDFIREFRQYIRWDLIPPELLSDEEFVIEFNNEIKQHWLNQEFDL